MSPITGIRPRPFRFALVLRLAAFLLAFLSGAAAMFAIQHATVKIDQGDVQNVAEVQNVTDILESFPTPASQDQVLTNPALPAVPQLLPEADAKINPPHSADEPAVKPLEPEIAVIARNVEALDLVGVTEPAPGRFAKLPLATNQSIAFVDVRVGDKVKKGYQVFSHWESPERLQAAKTEIEKLKKVLDVARSREIAASQTVERLKRVKGSVAAQELQDAETMSSIRQGEVQAAQLAVNESESRYAAMEFEFGQAFVTTPIDGTVAFVEVTAGERRQLGGPFRGVTILDSRVLHCRCLLDPSQLSLLEKLGGQNSQGEIAAGSAITPATSIEPSADEQQGRGNGENQRVRVSVESEGMEWNAKIVSVGQLADPKSGLIPVILEIDNPAETLRCGIRVNVSFRGN